MFKWLLVCFVAVAIAKWSQKVQADELNNEEKKLLQALEEELDQSPDKRGADDCDTEECYMDDDCALECYCSEQCEGDTDFETCKADCMNSDNLKRRMSLAARNQERTNEEVSNNNNNKQEKKIFGIRIPPVRRWVPPVPPVRRWVPPIPPVRRWVPPVPPVRRWVPPVPPVRRWVPPSRRWFRN